jgi:hypothetical protein
MAVGRCLLPTGAESRAKVIKKKTVMSVSFYDAFVILTEELIR